MGLFFSKSSDKPVIEPNRKPFTRAYQRSFSLPDNHVEFYQKYPVHGEVMYGIRDYHIDLLSSTTGIDSIEVCLNLVNYVYSFDRTTKSPEAYALYYGANLFLKHVQATNNELSKAVVRNLEDHPNKKRKQSFMTSDRDQFSNSMNHHAMSEIVNQSGNRPITYSYAIVCTGEKLTTNAMIGHSVVGGTYRDWKTNPDVTQKVNQMIKDYHNSVLNSDPFLEKVKKFGAVWKLYYAKCRLAKPHKITALNEFFIRFEREVYGGNQLPEVFAKMITGNNLFLKMTNNYNQTQRR